MKSKILGVKCGQDKAGNIYFCHKNDSKKRWVIFKGNDDASKVCPQWHGWLHGYLDAPLDEEDATCALNLTGTDCSHNPDKTCYKPKNNMQTWKP